MILDLARRRAAVAARRRLRALPTVPRELALSLAAGTRRGPTVLPGPPDGPVLVVAPHPDDEVIGPGGAVARHLDRGDRVTVLLVTSGGATAGGGRAVEQAREAETREALAILADGAPPPELRCARMPDGGLAGLVPDVAVLLAEHARGCATVYLPSLLDPHPDHHAVALAAGVAALDPEALDPEVLLLAYEVWAAGPVDALLDVTAVFARKQAALGAYRVALETVDYVRAASGLAAYRSASGGLGGRGFAEGFTVRTAAEHASLVADLPRPRP